MEFDKLLEFFEFLHKSTNIKRTVKLQGKEDFENNAEHSFQLALLCWYLVDYFNLKLNRELILKYTLAHDLVEVYAGDTDPFIHSKEFISSKSEREAQAIHKIESKFFGFENLIQTIKQYEEKDDDEAKFVYVVDKIVPSINTYLSADTYYKDNDVTLEKELDWFQMKENKITISQPELKQIIEGWKDFLKKYEKDIFKV